MKAMSTNCSVLVAMLVGACVSFPSDAQERSAVSTEPLSIPESAESTAAIPAPEFDPFHRMFVGETWTVHRSPSPARHFEVGDQILLYRRGGGAAAIFMPKQTDGSPMANPVWENAIGKAYPLKVGRQLVDGKDRHYFCAEGVPLRNEEGAPLEAHDIIFINTYDQGGNPVPDLMDIRYFHRDGGWTCEDALTVDEVAPDDIMSDFHGGMVHAKN